MPTAFFIRLNGKFKAISFDEVLYVSAKNNYCEIVTSCNKKLLVYVSLSRLEEKLPENLFCRIHRSHIISVGKIDSFDHNHVEIAKQLLPLNKAGYEEIAKRVILISGEMENRIKNEMEGMDVEEYLKKVRKQRKNNG